MSNRQDYYRERYLKQKEARQEREAYLDLLTVRDEASNQHGVSPVQASPVELGGVGFGETNYSWFGMVDDLLRQGNGKVRTWKAA